jgi:ASCH domain
VDCLGKYGEILRITLSADAPLLLIDGIVSVKILSVRQPWASLIVNGHKDVENRTWNTRYRGSLLIHASQRSDDVSDDEIEDRFGIRLPASLPKGGIVGITELVDCVKVSASPWHVSHHWGFLLTNSRRLPFQRWKGALSIRDVPPDLMVLLKL